MLMLSGPVEMFICVGCSLCTFLVIFMFVVLVL